MNPIRIGSRKSRLALKQTDIVIDFIQQTSKNTIFELEAIVTAGDIDMSLPKNDESLKDKFVKEIEVALLNNKIDLAIHSLKDLPVNMPNGLVIPFFPKREDARDCLVSSYSFDELPLHAKIGTSSLRRMNQLKALRPDLQVTPIRGNINTRIQKMKDGEFDGIVIAYAGVLRLNLEHEVSTIFSLSQIVPAPGQGILGVQMRENDSYIKELVEPINDIQTAQSATIELELNRLYGGGCHTPFGAHAIVGANGMVDLYFYCLETLSNSTTLEISIQKQYPLSSLYTDLAFDIEQQKEQSV